jgi:tetratricopeptide (TPR) repeat protein
VKPLAAKRPKPAPAFSAFISHAKADAKKAQAIADGLEARGFKCWIVTKPVWVDGSQRREQVAGVSGKDLAYLYNDRGYLYMIDGDLDRGRADLDRAIQIDPEIYHPYWNRAEILRRKGDSEGARADYHKALSLNPKTEDRQKIEASLGALAAKSDSGDPAVITSPIWGNDGERAASVPAYPAGEAMPAYPASPPLAVSPTPMPAAPQPFPGR